MGLTRLGALLRRHRFVGLDTNIFIYQLEANPRYVGLSDEVFRWLESPNHGAVTSTITLTELLAQPYRDEDQLRVNTFYGLLTTYPHLTWLAPDLEIADVAARLRASHGLRTPDAIQAATAVRAQATAFITNDPVFNRVPEFDAIVLDRFL